jgi:hypothetical protein
MKKYTLIIISACLVLLSCDNGSEIKPEAAFIKANVNGIETVFSVLPEEQLNYIAIGQNYFAITLYKGEPSYEYWVFVVSNVDIDKIKLPFTIKGPNPDFSGQSPEFYTIIYDPNDGPYGRAVAGAHSIDNEISATITSVTGDVIKGTFQGSGFLNGKFQAKLPRLKL